MNLFLVLSVATLAASQQVNNDRYNQQGQQQYDPRQYSSQEQGRQFGQFDPQRPNDPRQQSGGQFPQNQFNQQGGQFPQGQGQGQNQGQNQGQGQFPQQGQQGGQFPQQGQFDRDRNQYNPQNNNQNNPQNNPQNNWQNDRNQYNPSGTQFDPNNNNNFGGQGGGSGGRFDEGNCCEEYCFRQDENPYLKYGTKTAYTFTFGKSNNQHRVPQCKPVQYWQLIRHGTRLPNREAIQRLQQLTKIHDEISRNYMDRKSFPDKGRLCPEDFQLLMNWRWNDSISMNNALSLTDQGVTDIKFMARRYQTRFKELLSVPYSDNYYYFQYSDRDKSHDNYQAFIEGLFGQNAFQVRANIQMEQNLAKSYENCHAWNQQVNNNYDTMLEYDKFKQKQEYRELVRNVFRRLGFRYVLNDTIIEDMYDMCRYDKAWNIERHSSWCTAFTKDQLKLLEYGEDLKYYYKSGYGNDLNKQVGCPPLKDMYDRFEKTVNGDKNQPKVTVFFTHTTALQTLLVAMGMYKDNTPLTADNYFTQTRRQWRTSQLTPFAGNLAAVLYECDQGEKSRVMFFLNEVPVDLPGCSVGLCNWSTLKQKMQETAMSCNLDFCDRSGANVHSSTLSASFLTLLLTLFTYKFNH